MAKGRYERTSEPSRPTQGAESRPTDIEREFRYGRSWGNLFVCLLLFGTFSAAGIFWSLTDRRGMIINGIITFSPDGATVLRWTCTQGPRI